MPTAVCLKYRRRPDATELGPVSHGACLLVKEPASDDSSMLLEEWSNLWMIDDASLRERSLYLMRTLGAADLLVSDISSVVIDYLLLIVR